MILRDDCFFLALFCPPNLLGGSKVFAVSIEPDKAIKRAKDVNITDAQNPYASKKYRKDSITVELGMTLILTKTGILK